MFGRPARPTSPSCSMRSPADRERSRPRANVRSYS
jgi:hypothetical protein